MTVQDHATAFQVLLEHAPPEAPAPALEVHMGAVPPRAQPPYVVVYLSDSDPEDADSRPLNGRSERFVMRATCHSVGGNETAALAVAQRVRAALLDVRPTVAGRTCQPIRREDGQPVRRDESTGTVVQDKVDVYRLESVPA